MLMVAMKTQLNPLSDLEELELRVARRADELMQQAGAAGALPMHCWLLAEREILGVAFGDLPLPSQGASDRASREHPVASWR
jgi:hypothetical protein